MNRHHYSLYVHNCRLVFLLRRDFAQVDTFRPAEFHWKLEQVRHPDTLVLLVQSQRSQCLSRFAAMRVRMNRKLDGIPHRFEFPS